MRMAILDHNDVQVAFIDNDALRCLHYFNDKLHTYLKGSNFTFEFTVYKNHDDVVHLVNGNHISFMYKNKPYYSTIVRTSEDEYTMNVLCYGLVFELLNETLPKYAGESHTFVDHLNAFGFAKGFYRIGINELPTVAMTFTSDSEQTALARIYSLASEFDAEVEFITELNNDYSLKDILINIYHKHSASHQGMGNDRTYQIIRYGKEIKGVGKTTEITELITAIKPYGENNLDIKKKEYYEYDANGELAYSSPLGDDKIYAHLSKDRFPSNLITGDRFINYVFNVQSNNVDVVFKEGLERLKTYCEPRVSYTVKGYIDADIGDTFTIEDDAYRPTLYIRARVTEQEISTTNPTDNTTTFDNFIELDSQISASLQDQIKYLLENNRTIVTNIVKDALDLNQKEITWGNSIKTSTNEGKIGMRAITNYPDPTTAEVVIEVWFWSQSLVSDSRNSFYFKDNATTVGTTTTKTNLPVVTTEKNWSEKNKLLLYTTTLSFQIEQGGASQTRHCSARLKGIDVLSGNMDVTIEYTI